MADLTYQHISQSYQNLIQFEDSNKVLTDGLGNKLNTLTLSGSLAISGTLSGAYTLQLNTARPNPTHQEGLVFYDSGSKALAVYNDESDITLQVGQEMWNRVHNSSGALIEDGKVVYISGSTGGLSNIYLAKSDKRETCEDVIGVATHDIEIDTIGYVTTDGIVNDIDTSGSTEGAAVYVSPTVAGEFTMVKPTPPDYDFHVGHIITADAATGKLLVKIGSIRDFFTQTIRVEPSGGDFTSISGALASINDASETKRYSVVVGPGIYNEDNPIQLKEYVQVGGDSAFLGAAIVQANDTGSYIFKLGNRAQLKSMNVGGSRGCDVAALYMDIPGACPLNELILSNCSVGIEVDNENAWVDVTSVFGYTDPGETIDTMIYLKNGNMNGLNVRVLINSKVNTMIKVEGTGSTFLGNSITHQTENVNIGIHVLDGGLAIVKAVNLLPLDPSSKPSYGVLCEGKGGFIPSRLNITAMDLYFMERGMVANDGGIINVSTTKISSCEIGVLIEDSGSNSEIAADTTVVVRSIDKDLQIKSDTAKFFGASNKLDTTKLDINQNASIYTSFVSDVPDDEGLNIFGELHVGSPEFPSEAVFGEGDSYTRGMLIYTYNSSGTGSYKDVTVSGSSIGDGLYIEFPNTGSGDAIYLASTIEKNGDYTKHFGLKILSTQLVNTGSGIAIPEYYNGSSWIPFNFMLTDAAGEYLPHGIDFGPETGSYHLRYDWRMNQDWATSDLMGIGTDYYWARYRILLPILQSFRIEQMKIHSNRSEINEDGFIEYFGKARPFGTLPWDINLTRPGTENPADQNVWLSDNLDVGRSDNKFRAGSTDRIGFNGYLPDDLDTSCPIQLQWSAVTDVTDGGNIGWIVRWGWSTEGDSVYTGSVAAPTTSSNEQTSSLSSLSPTAMTQKTYNRDLQIPRMISRRESGSFSDMLWLTLQRSDADTHTGDVSVINLVGKYTKWCEGGHQFQ